MLSSHSPASAKVANAHARPTRCAHPPKRSASSVPATVVPTHVIQSSSRLNQLDEMVDEVEKPLEEREDERCVLGIPLGRGSRSGSCRGGRESAFQTRRSGHGYSSAQSR